MHEYYDLHWKTDNSHGWLQVPRILLAETGIAKEISSWSRMDGDMAYLERDTDAPVFLQAMREDFPDIVVRTYTDETVDRSPVRDMASYVPGTFKKFDITIRLTVTVKAFSRDDFWNRYYDTPKTVWLGSIVRNDDWSCEVDSVEESYAQD